MGDLTAPQIEPMTQGNEFDKPSPKKGQQRKRETNEKVPPSPSIEPDDPIESIHQIDELA